MMAARFCLAGVDVLGRQALDHRRNEILLQGSGDLGMRAELRAALCKLAGLRVQPQQTRHGRPGRSGSSKA